MPPLTLSILDPTSLLGRDAAERVAEAFPQARRRFFHTTGTEEHLIAEVAGEAALVAPLADVDELTGTTALVATAPPAPGMGEAIVAWLREHPEVFLVDATQPGLAAGESTVVAGPLSGAPRATRWFHLADPALAGPVHFLAALANLQPQTLVMTVISPASSFGDGAIEELVKQSVARLSGRPPRRATFLPDILAFDFAPAETERTTTLEGQLGELFPALELRLQLIDAGVFHGYGAAVHLRCAHPLRPEGVRALLRAADTVRLARRNEHVRPSEVVGDDRVTCGELRLSRAWLSAWLAADGMRLGGASAVVAALEAVMAS